VEAEKLGYTGVLFFIGTSPAEVSNGRVAMRELKGGHEGGQDVAADKLKEGYGRVLRNLQRALVEVCHVRVYDNSDLRDP
jgi:predicted ABC-type ATPase